MEKNKKIWDYFDDSVDYPREVAHNTLPYGTVWSYISATFLNGFVNYVKPISVFVLDKYTMQDENISDRDVNIFDKGKFGNWHKWEGTKGGLIEAIKSGEKETYHTQLNWFGDDTILLSEIETDEKDGKGRYMFFWFDLDVSGCCIGKFETTDAKEQVVQSVVNWLEDCKLEDDNEIKNYTEIPISFLGGWISF